MKPTKDHYNAAMEALDRLSLTRPEFDSRAPAALGSTEHLLADAVGCLSYTAGMYAAAESTHYTREQFAAALNFVGAQTPEFSYWSPRPATKPIHNEAPKVGNRSDRRRAERLAGRLGLTDRAGNAYPMA